MRHTLRTAVLGLTGTQTASVSVGCWTADDDADPGDRPTSGSTPEGQDAAGPSGSSFKRANAAIEAAAKDMDRHGSAESSEPECHYHLQRLMPRLGLSLSYRLWCAPNATGADTMRAAARHVLEMSCHRSYCQGMRQGDQVLQMQKGRPYE